MCVCGEGAATWSVTLRDKCKLRVFQNRMLRMIVASKRTTAVSQFTLRTRCYLGDTIKKDMLGGACGVVHTAEIKLTNFLEQGPS